MRIISGSARGVRLDSPNGLNTRPTTDRVKENIFNVIQFEIHDAKVLDLFAGTGALGIESLSRGASSLISVDSSRECTNIINSNLKRAKLDNKAIVQNKNVEFFFRDIQNQQFDIVFADPPYRKGLCDYVMEMLINGNHLVEHAIVVLEHAKDENILLESDEKFIFRKKIYGNTAVSICRRTSK